MKKKKLIIILLILVLSVIIGTETYAYYVSNMKVNVTATGSNIICDAEIKEVSNEEKNKYGYSEFKVIVKNHDSSNNLTKESFNYTLSVENTDNSNGMFANNGEFDNTLEITDTMSNNESTDKAYFIQVKTENGTSANVKYKVKLNCIQNN